MSDGQPDVRALEQAGWPGTLDEWRKARKVILDGINRGGDILDIGCRNGLLLAQLVDWAADRGHVLTPHGIDNDADLIDLARERFPVHRENFHHAATAEQLPAGVYDIVHVPLDHVPEARQQPFLQRLLTEAVAPGGRLIVSSYASYDRSRKPVDVDLHLQFLGFRTTGCGNSLLDGTWVATRSAWVDR